MKNISFIYEIDCGGETNATENILSELKKYHELNIKEFKLQTQKKTSLLPYFYWIIKSIFNSYIFIIRTGKANGTIYTTTYTAAIAGLLTKLIRNNNVVIHYHGNRIPEFTTKPTQILKYLVVYSLHFLAFRLSDILIVPSSFSKKQLSKKNLLNKKTFTIPNGVDLDHFYRYSKPKIWETKNKYHLNRYKKIISNISRIVEKKGIIKLLHLLPLLQKKHDNLCLILAHPKIKTDSEKKYLQRVLSFIKKNDIKSVIFFEDKNIADIYNLSNLVISFSQEENFPLVLLESYACKTKFVTSNEEIRQLQTDLYKTEYSRISWKHTAEKIYPLLINSLP